MYITSKKIEGNDVAAYLDISDLDIPNQESLQHLLTFKIKTYIKLRQVRHSYNEETDSFEDESFEMAFATINNLLNTLSKDDQAILANGMMLMHHTIREFFINNEEIIKLTKMLKVVGDLLDKIDQDINLCDQINKYIENNIKVGLMKDAGKRAQDSEEMTFHPNQVYELMTITLLCKILTPIFSVLMDYLSDRIDPNLKEMHCAAIMAQLLDRRYNVVIEKLQYYIRKTIDRLIEENTSTLMHGYSLETLSHHMYVSLLARKFVNVDLRENDGKNNLVTFILVSIKKSVRTIISNTKKKPTYSRIPVTPKHDDDGNTAQLEIDSMTSRKTIDVGPIVSASINKVIREFKYKYQITQDEYDASLEFYRRNPIVPNIINKDMNAMFFGKAIGGAQGLLLLHSPEYTELTCLLQLIIFSLDANYTELGHMLTANLADNTNDNSVANMFRVKAGNSIAYRTVRNSFETNPYGVNGKYWDNYINKISENLTTNKYIYNTSNFIWNWLEEDNLNGKIFIPSENVVTAICHLYQFIITETEGI